MLLNMLKIEYFLNRQEKKNILIALCFLFKNSGLGVVSTLLLIEKLSPHCSASCNKFSASSPPQRLPLASSHPEMC